MLLVDNEFVFVIFARMAVKATAALFQVCVIESGADDVVVPMLADSVVKAPEFGVVDPMADGLARFVGAVMNPPTD
jgi:hypothetical protein